MQLKLDPKGAAALRQAAAAFERAKRKGYVWIGEDGRYQTHEQFDMPVQPKVIHPDQLRLA